MQPGVLVSALWTPAKIRPGQCCVESITPNTVKAGFTSFQLKPPIVPAVIVKPKAEKGCGQAEAVDDNRGGELEHPRST